MGIVRLYKVGDEEKILSLFNQVFKQNRDMKHWWWQFKENPGGETIIALAEDEDKIFGQVTLAPSKMNLGDSESLGGQSIDVMVDKNYRRQGYYEKLAFYSYEIAKEKNILFRYGFPSLPALEGLLNKLGGKLVCEIPLYTDIYRVDRLASSILKNQTLSKIISLPIHLVLKVFKGNRIKANKNYEVLEINRFDKDFDQLWEQFRNRGMNMTVRSSDFLNWRVATHPNIKYYTFGAFNKGIKGYIVLKVEERKVKGKHTLRVGSIVDVVALDDDAFLHLNTKAKEFFRNQDVDFVVTWIMDNSPFKHLFKKMGFIRTRSRIPFVVRNLSDDTELDKFLFDEDKWHLMPIEADTY